MKNTVKIEDIKFGIKEVYADDGYFVSKFTCACGETYEGRHVERNTIPESHTCLKCNNNYFTNKFKVGKFIAPFFTVDFKNHRGFGISRTNVSILVEELEDYSYKINLERVNMSRKIVFDYPDKTLICYKNGEVEYDFHSDPRNKNKSEEDIVMPRGDVLPTLLRINNFVLRNVTFDEFVEQIGTDKTKEFYEYINDRLYNGNGKAGDKQILKRLRQLLLLEEEFDWAQILSNAGIKNLDLIGRNTGYASPDGSWRNRISVAINKDGKTPSEILKLPKALIKVVLKIQELGVYKAPSFIKSIWEMEIKDNKFDHNKVMTILSFGHDDETLSAIVDELERFYQIVNDQSIKTGRMLEYILEELPMYQGITRVREGLTLLDDYIRMCREMGYEPDKYPKSLKKVHDIAMVNYSKFKENISNDDFKISVSRYNHLMEMSNRKKFSFLLPESSKDLVSEGNALSHCVASYSNKVLRGETQIVFMRDSKEIEKPLVTIEINGDRIVQARGRFNRSLTQIEKDAVKKWSDKKEISCGY